MFAYMLAGGEENSESILFLIHGLLNKDESYLKLMFKDPVEETIKLLEKFEIGILKFDEIFSKKEEPKNHKLIIK